MSESTLTQDEIDALLQGSEEASVDEAPSAQARPYDLGRELGQAPARITALDVVADRFAKEIKSALVDLFKCRVALGAPGNSKLTFKELKDQLPEPLATRVFRPTPMHGLGLMAVEQELVCRIVDHYYAGPGWSPQETPAEFSPTESRLATRLADELSSRWDGCWENVLAMRSERVAEGHRLSLLNHFASDERFLLLSFLVQQGDWQSSIHIALPIKGLLEYQDQLLKAPVDEHPDRRRGWRGRLGQSLMAAEVPIRCRIATASLQLRDVIELSPGDVISADVPALHKAFAGPMPLFEGTLGESRGRLALEVTRTFNKEADL
ncbi:MAG: FliM/FliN family flagellar motor switch protein [Pseudomonadota bacterium]